MLTPNKNEVRTILSRIEADLFEIVHAAWEDWKTISKSHPPLFPRTQANYVWDLMVRRALDVLPLKPGIRCLERNQSFWFIVDNHVLFRFKKGDTRGLSSNYPTQQALAFHNHQNLTLFGPVHFLRVEVVYVLNSLRTLVNKVYIVARNSKNIDWIYEIHPETATVEELPHRHPPQTSPEQLLRTRAEREIIKEEQ